MPSTTAETTKARKATYSAHHAPSHNIDLYQHNGLNVMGQRGCIPTEQQHIMGMKNLFVCHSYYINLYLVDTQKAIKELKKCLGKAKQSLRSGKY